MQPKSRLITQEIAQSALFTALIFATTYLLKIPTPTGGYIHLGDGFLMLSALLLKRRSAVISSALGAALADLAGGYLIYVPATLIIKAVGAMFLATFAPKLRQGKGKGLPFLYLPLTILTNAMMLLGYFIFERFIYDWSIALLGVPGNLMQGCAAILLSYVLSFSLKPFFSAQTAK